MMVRVWMALIAVCLCSTALARNEGITADEIRLGASVVLSGPLGPQTAQYGEGSRLMFDAVNAAGGIHGRKIRYIVEDNQYQVPRSIQAANKLINRDNVFLMIANGGTPMNNAVMPDQLAKGVQIEDKPSPKRAISSQPVVKPIRVNAPNSVFALGNVFAKS